MEIELVIGDYKLFLDKVFGNLKTTGFNNDEFQELDHIAYRVENLEAYAEIKKKLIDFSKSYSDEIFGGRPVLVCQLKTPLVYNEFKIEGIEVLAPKENNKYRDGLQHAEFVVKNTLEKFLEKHKDAEFDLEDYSREINPEAEVKFENCAVKFHKQSLLKVRNIHASH